MTSAKAPFGVTPAQMAILNALWELGEGTAHDVQAVLKPRRRYAITTVGTMLQRLEVRGLVTHRSEGRNFVYRAATTPAKVKRSVIRAFEEVADQLFADDTPELVSHLLSSRRISPEEIEQIAALVREATERRQR